MQTITSDLLVDLRRTGSKAELRVFMALVTNMEFRRCFPINRAALARAEGMHKPDVSVAVKSLLARGILCESTLEPQCFFFNPELLHMGDDLDREYVQQRSCCHRIERSNAR